MGKSVLNKVRSLIGVSVTSRLFSCLQKQEHLPLRARTRLSSGYRRSFINRQWVTTTRQGACVMRVALLLEKYGVLGLGVCARRHWEGYVCVGGSRWRVADGISAVRAQFGNCAEFRFSVGRMSSEFGPDMRTFGLLLAERISFARGLGGRGWAGQGGV